MANERLTGPQKAAIFLFGLGEDVASQIVKGLDEEEIKKLGSSIAKVHSVPPKILETIFAEFQQRVSGEVPLQLGPSGRDQFLRSVISKAMEGEKAQSLFEKIQEEGKWNLFQKIRRLPPKTLANFIQNEHPQTIAVVLAHVEPMQAAAVLEEFPLPLQTEVLYRITQLENVPPGIVEEIDETLQQEIALLENPEGRKMGGVQSAAEILNEMESSAEGALLQSIEEQKQGLADDIRRLMFVFEDLARLDDRSVVTLLKEVNSETLKLALKTASEELKEKLFRNMSERASQLLKEDLEVMGPVRLKDVEAAQLMIIKSAKKLENEGKIALRGKAKEEIFV